MTLGISLAVSSCIEPFLTAICWFLALSSWRKAPAHRIESSSLLLLLLFARAEHLPQPRLQRRVCWALAASVEPVFKILNFDDMRNLRMPDLHGYGGQSFSDIADPVVTAQRGESLGNGFVQGLGGHIDCVLDLVQIVDNDSAGFKCHDGNLSYSPFVRL
jgi:hypothetical protein